MQIAFLVQPNKEIKKAKYFKIFDHQNNQYKSSFSDATRNIHVSTIENDNDDQ